MLNRLRCIVAQSLRTYLPNWWAYRTYLQAHKKHIVFYGGYDNKDLATYIDDFSKFFLPAEKLTDSKYMKQVIIDIVRCHWDYGTNPTEFFCYGFLNKGKAERAEY